MIVSFEGIDKSGKYTQSNMLADALHVKGHKIFWQSFPRKEITFELVNYIDGHIEGEKARDRLKQHTFTEDMHEFLLDTPLLEDSIFIFDRWIHSTLAHSEMLGIDAKPYIAGLPQPDIVFFMKLNPNDPRVESYFDKEQLELVNTIYGSYTIKGPHPLWYTLDASDRIMTNHNKILHIVEEHIKKFKYAEINT